MRDDLLLLGWFLADRLPQPEWMTGGLAPDPVLSASSCICDVHPDFLDDLIAEDSALAAFTQANTVNDFGNLMYLASREVAREMIKRWYKDHVPLGLALPLKHKEAMERSIAVWQDDKNPKLEPQPWTGREVVLGFEVLGNHAGWHSYLCNSLEQELFDVFKTRVNAFGFIGEERVAEDFAAYLRERELGEPVYWLPLAVVQHEDDIVPAPRNEV